MVAQYNSTQDAARHITMKYGVPCSPNWLAKIRSTGGSAPFYRIGRNVFYLLPELEQWFESRIARRTSRSTLYDRRAWETQDIEYHHPGLSKAFVTGDTAFDEITRIEFEAPDLEKADLENADLENADLEGAALDPQIDAAIDDLLDHAGENYQSSFKTLS